MNDRLVFLVPSERDKYIYQSFCPDASVVTRAADLDRADFEDSRIVVVGGVDFLGGIVERLRARCLAGNISRFTVLLTPQQASRLRQIERFLDSSGLKGKYELIVPQDGFVRAVSRLIMPATLHEDVHHPNGGRPGVCRADEIAWISICWPHRRS